MIEHYVCNKKMIAILLNMKCFKSFSLLFFVFKIHIIIDFIYFYYYSMILISDLIKIYYLNDIKE